MRLLALMDGPLALMDLRSQTGVALHNLREVSLEQVAWFEMIPPPFYFGILVFFGTTPQHVKNDQSQILKSIDDFAPPYYLRRHLATPGKNVIG